MKVFFTVMSLFLPLCLSAQSPVWADEEKPGDHSQLSEMEQQRQSATEELMSILKETMGILRNLDGKPSADEKKRLDAMISRLDVLLVQQQEMMQRMQEELQEEQQKEILQLQDDILRRRK
jgi:hypothetical protein